MTEVDFEHISDWASDWLPKTIRQRYEGNTTRVLFLADDDGIIEIRWTKK